MAFAIAVLPPGGALADYRLQDSGSARVAAVSDGRTILLDDGREILLAGIEAAPAWPQARAEIARRLMGQTVALKGLAATPDRYGRRAAFVAVNGSDIPVQYDLLRQGLVRAGPLAPADCRAELLSEERKARAARVGLWSDPGYEVRRADDPAAIAAGRGRFAVIEGKVLSVRESGGTIYVNFGQRWSEDFTATIPKRLESRLTSAGVTPGSLSGRNVRIRGFVEERGGPWIEIIRPDQIEFADLEQ